MASIMSDVWKVYHTNAGDAALPNNTNKLSEANIGNAISTALRGVGSNVT